MALLPIYQYRTTLGYLRFFYTTQNPITNAGFCLPADDVKNWSLDGVAFFAWDSPTDGAQPVYQYQYPVSGVGGPPPDSLRYLYTLNPGAMAGTGWVPTSPNNQTPAFYAFVAPPPPPVGFAGDGGLAQFAQWYMNNTNYGTLFLGCMPQTAVTGNFLAPSGWSPVGWSTGPGQGSQPFWALPGAVQLAYYVQHIKLASMPTAMSPKLVGSEDLSNFSASASISQDVSYQMQLSTSFSLSLTETLSVSAAQNVSAEIPGLGGASETITLEVDLSSTQSVSTTTTQTVQIDSTVSIGPTSYVTVTGLVNVVANEQIPCYLMVLVTTVSNGVALNTPAVVGSPCAALIALFAQQNPSFTNSSGITPVPQLGGIQILLNGYLTCSFGVNTELQVEDVPPPDPSAAAEKVKLAKANMLK